MSSLVASNVVASRPPERRPTGTPYARANIDFLLFVLLIFLRCSSLVLRCNIPRYIIQTTWEIHLQPNHVFSLLHLFAEHTEMEDIRKKALAIINKLTPKSFKTLVARFQDLSDTQDKLYTSCPWRKWYNLRNLLMSPLLCKIDFLTTWHDVLTFLFPVLPMPNWCL